MSNPRRDGEAQVRQACIKFLDDPPMSIPWQVEPECLDVLMKFVQRQRAEVWREAAKLCKETKVLTDDPINHAFQLAYECEARAREGEEDVGK